MSAFRAKLVERPLAQLRTRGKARGVVWGVLREREGDVGTAAPFPPLPHQEGVGRIRVGDSLPVRTYASQCCEGENSIAFDRVSVTLPRSF